MDLEDFSELPEKLALDPEDCTNCFREGNFGFKFQQVEIDFCVDEDWDL